MRWLKHIKADQSLEKVRGAMTDRLVNREWLEQLDLPEQQDSKEHRVYPAHLVKQALQVQWVSKECKEQQECRVVKAKGVTQGHLALKEILDSLDFQELLVGG